MLLAEQYLLIYLLSVYLFSHRDIKIISLFCFLCFLFEEYFLSISIKSTEFNTFSYFCQLLVALILLNILKSVLVKITLSLICISLSIPYLFISNIDYLIQRNDLFSYYFYILCGNIVHYLNEIIVSTYFILEKRNDLKKVIYIKAFIIINYFSVLLGLLNK